jgi:hypothetical protein
MTIIPTTRDRTSGTDGTDICSGEHEENWQGGDDYSEVTLHAGG